MLVWLTMLSYSQFAIELLRFFVPSLQISLSVALTLQGLYSYWIVAPQTSTGSVNKFVQGILLAYLS